MDKMQTAWEFARNIDRDASGPPGEYAEWWTVVLPGMIRSRDRAIVERCKDAVWQALYGQSADEAMRRADTLGGEIVSAIDSVLRDLEGKEGE